MHAATRGAVASCACTASLHTKKDSVDLGCVGGGRAGNGACYFWHPLAFCVHRERERARDREEKGRGVEERVCFKENLWLSLLCSQQHSETAHLKTTECPSWTLALHPRLAQARVSVLLPAS